MPLRSIQFIFFSKEEQELVLDWIERAKEQLEAEKAEFLRREHDLLVRVLNERALLEQERREFIRQRDADVSRLRLMKIIKNYWKIDLGRRQNIWSKV